ncbi:hypothetical protein ACFL5Q_06990 [Planctomycetota bacterium]
MNEAHGVIGVIDLLARAAHAVKDRQSTECADVDQFLEVAARNDTPQAVLPHEAINRERETLR